MGLSIVVKRSRIWLDEISTVIGRSLMENRNEYIKNLYLTDEYILKNPSLHEEDSAWKASKIIPLIDLFTRYFSGNEINLLDVGGGAGVILNKISIYIEHSFGIQVNKFALDLSPGMLEIQKKLNPDLKTALNEDISKTSLDKKEIDLTLMIDILEHVLNPTEALEELRRISKFVIFKVPLDDNLLSKVWNFMRRGKPRQLAIEEIGHINIYNFNKLKYQIEKHTGQVLDFYFTNAFDYLRHSKYYNNKMRIRHRVKNFIAVCMIKLSPKLCSLIFGDFVVMLIKCY